MDSLALAGATVVLASAALFATFLTVRRAARIEPTAALRYE
jgi:ABC-type lipoprotein release transport system permease subunit